MSGGNTTVKLRGRSYRVGGDYDIHISEAGEGEPVVFIHGSGPGASGASNFRQNIGAFVDAGYRVLAPDLIGYGASSKPEGIDYTLELFTSTLLDALRQAGIERATLIGNSLGGGAAIQIALDNPRFVDKLILMAPGCIEEQAEYFKMPGIAKMVGDFTSPEFTEADQRRLLSNLVYDPSVITDDLVADRFRVSRAQPKDVLVRMRTPNLGPRLGELKMPILGFWGAAEQFMPLSGVEKFLKACPNARFMVFTEVGHWVQVERTQEFNAYAIAFLGGR